MEAEVMSAVLDSASDPNAESDSMSSVLASVSSRKEKAAKAVASLHSHRNLLTSCITVWEDLERSFGVAERALQQKFKELAEREREYDSRMKDARVVLDKREESIAGREESSLARVKEQKDGAFAPILEERRKLEEEQLKMRGGEKGSDIQVGKEVESAGQETGTHNSGRPMVIESEETQRKKHSGIATTPNETRAAQMKAGSKSSIPFKNSKKEKEAHIASSCQKEEQRKQRLDLSVKKKREDASFVDETASKRRKEGPVSEAKAIEGPENDTSSKSAPLLGEAINQVKPFSGSEHIKSLVDRMDANGLKDWLANNRRHYQEIKPQLQSVLLASTDPCRMVLMVLEGSGGTNRMVASSKIAHACSLLLECLSEVVADPVLGVEYPVVPSDVKELAKTLARRWKAKLDGQGREFYTLDSHVFVRLLATFGIGSEYNDEELLTCLIAMSRRGMGPALCRTLGLTNAVPVIIEKLVKEGKVLEAIAYSSAFGMLEVFRPESLLKSHLEKAMQTNNTASSGNDALNTLYTMQISALKNAVKVIEEYSLSSQFSVEDLQKRIAILTQEKEELKKGNSTTKEDRKLKGGDDIESSRQNGITSNNEGGDSRPGSRTSAPPSYGSSLDRGHYPLTDVGWSSRSDYIHSELRQSFGHGDISYKYDGSPLGSSYAIHGLGSRSPASIPNSYGLSSRDGFMSGPLRPHLPSYGGMSRDEIDMLSAGRLSSYTGISTSSRDYNLGPSSSRQLPYYYRN